MTMAVFGRIGVVFGAIAAVSTIAHAQASNPSVAFTTAQADAGRRVYVRSCANCHGPRLDDGVALPLAGPAFLQKWSAPDRSLDDLWFVMRNTMPKNAGGTLPPSDYLAVLAYVLERNGHAAGDTDLVADHAELVRRRFTAPARQCPSAIVGARDP